MATMTNLGFGSSQTKNAMRGANKEQFTPIINGRSMRPPLKMVHIFSVAKRPFPIKHDLAKKLELRGCENGERYVLCASFPDPIVQSCPDHERGGTRLDDNDAWISVIDMLNSGNFTLDPYTGSANPDYYANRNGTNLICEGVFMSLNEEPTEEEIRRAEDCARKRAQYLTKEALRLAAISTKQLNEFLQRWPEVHQAMDVLGLTAQWHTPNQVKASCPNCGDEIKQNIAFHKSSAGVLCILDWKRAWEAGAIKKEDVPAKYRWKGFGKVSDEEESD